MLSDYLTPIPKNFFKRKDYSVSQWGKKLKVFQRKFPSLSNLKMAIIGIEHPDKQELSIQELPTYLIRKQLYALHSWENKLSIVDLGNVKNGATHRDTYFAISEVVAQLLAENIIPILIGHDLDLSYGQFLGHSQENKKVEVAMFDKTIDLFTTKEQSSFLYQMLTQETNLSNFTHIGYQRYLVNPSVIDGLEKLSFTCYSLGEIKDNLLAIEPVIRNKSMVAFKVGSIGYAAATGVATANPNGFSGHEACQIARYAGFSDYIQSFGLYGYVAAHDQRLQTAQLIAQMIWYFVDGVHNRQNDFPEYGEKDDYLTYLVQLDDYEVTFIKSKKSNRWWLESPATKSAKKRLIPCLYEDYELACRGEIPDRWVQVYKQWNADF